MSLAVVLVDVDAHRRYEYGGSGYEGKIVQT